MAREILLDRIVDAEVDHLKAGAFHHHADEVLADVVDVALDGADHHLAQARRAGGDEQRAEDEHAGLHGIGGQQHFRHEQNAVAEIDADDAHAFDEGFGQHLVGRPAAAQQDVDGGFDLFLEAVIEVVMDLQDQILVVEGVQIKFASSLIGVSEGRKYHNRIEGLPGLTLSSGDIHMPESDG